MVDPVLDICLLEYNVCDGGDCTRVYAGAFSSEAKALEAFDKLLDKKLLECEDAVNEWESTSRHPSVKEFRTGYCGYHVWTLRTIKLDSVGEVGRPWWEDVP